AFVKVEAESFPFFGSEAAKIGVVGTGHVGESETKTVVVGTNQLICVLPIDVVAEDDKRAFGVSKINAPRRVSQDYRSNAHSLEDADGEGDVFRGEAFVKMHSALHSSHRNIADFADH